MKRLPPEQIIAEYRSAYEAANEKPLFLIRYERGWFLVGQGDGAPTRYRGAQIIHMTGQLWGRVQSRKADHV